MKKIYFLRSNRTKFGGAENYLSRLCSELGKQGISYELKNSFAPKFLSSWIRAIWFNFQACFNKNRNFYFSLDRVTCSDIYRAGDGVHKEFIKTKKRKLNLLNLTYLYLEKKCFNNSKHIIANSHMIKNQIISTYGIDESKISIIYNGIKIKEKVNSQEIKKEFKIENEKIILYIGSGFERKGVKDALEIVSKLKNKTKFIIIGKEKKISHYKQLAKKLNVDAIFTGVRDDVDKFYSLADIFLFPTHYEPFSNVILEAMSFENAVFTTKQNGAYEILEDDFIMQTHKDYSISTIIDDLLQNQKKLEDIKKQNLKTAQNFTIEKNAKKTMDIIYEYLN